MAAGDDIPRKRGLGHRCRPTCSWSTRSTSRRTSAPTSSGCGPTSRPCARERPSVFTDLRDADGADGGVRRAPARGALRTRAARADRASARTGCSTLRLRRAAPDGRTVLAERRQRFPLRMTVPMYLDAGDRGMAFVYVQNPTGGVFAGDRLASRVDARPGRARAPDDAVGDEGLPRWTAGGAPSRSCASRSAPARTSSTCPIR